MSDRMQDAALDVQSLLERVRVLEQENLALWGAVKDIYAGLDQHTQRTAAVERNVEALHFNALPAIDGRIRHLEDQRP